MSFFELSAGFRTVWENQPTMVVLSLVGFLVFVFLVVDVWVLKRRRRRRPKHWRP